MFMPLDRHFHDPCDLPVIPTRTRRERPNSTIPEPPAVKGVIQKAVLYGSVWKSVIPWSDASRHATVPPGGNQMVQPRTTGAGLSPTTPWLYVQRQEHAKS